MSAMSSPPTTLQKLDADSAFDEAQVVPAAFLRRARRVRREGRQDAWDVDRLLVLSRDFPVKQVPPSAIWELDSPYWGERLTPRQVADHLRLANALDPGYPIILGADGRVMDGMHRIIRALVEGRETIAAEQRPTMRVSRRGSAWAADAFGRAASELLRSLLAPVSGSCNTG